jgi:hypothetical protein
VISVRETSASSASGSHINRRDFVTALGLTMLPNALRGQGGAEPIRYEVYGAGPTLMLGSPIALSSPAAIRVGYLDRLTDSFRVVLMDYLMFWPFFNASVDLRWTSMQTTRSCCFNSV